MEGTRVSIEYTPTSPACGMANVIGEFLALSYKSLPLTDLVVGLAIMVRLTRSLPPRYKVKIRMTPGSHQHVDQGMLVL